MIKYEYRIIRKETNQMSKKELNALGFDGWKLCAICPLSQHYGVPEHDFYFARAIEESGSE